MNSFKRRRLSIETKEKDKNCNEIYNDNNNNSNKLTFQQFEIDHYIFNNNKPIIRIFGVTSKGKSVCCHIHDFLPYFYIKAGDYNPEKDKINSELSSSLGGHRYPIKDIILIHDKSNIFGYQKYLCQEKFWKITVALPKFINIIKKYILSIKADAEFFETNIEYEMRFMIDTKLMGCSWIELPPGTWQCRRKEYEKQTLCKIEVDTQWNKFISHLPENEWSNVAPLKILSFDIECNNRPDIFPEPEYDSVIQIGNVIQCYGENETEKVIFTLKSCAHIDGVKVISFENELDMLEKWSEFVRREIDPDILTGYNINGFDIPYLLERVSALEKKYKIFSSFNYLGRIKNIKSKIYNKDNILQSRQIGFRISKVINIEGRCQFDMMIVMLREFKLRSYSLNAVAIKFLSKQKDDVHPSTIATLQSGDENDRCRLAKYCIKDAELPLELMWKLASLTNYIEMVRVAGIPLPYLLTRGLQIRIFSQILRKAKAKGFIIPVIERNDDDVFEEYEGATVITPKVGYYNVPIATLDFASLYPSIMIAYNLCYTTFLNNSINNEETSGNENNINSSSISSSSSNSSSNNSKGKEEEEEIFTQTPSNDYFVKRNVRKGLLPEILEFLIGERKKVKAMLKCEVDIEMKKILEGRQLALKIYANAVYGFTGAQVGKLPCLSISRSVTAYGREMIEYAKNQVLEKYNTNNGYAYNSDIIYGDTDSIMINFFYQNNTNTSNNEVKVQEAMNLGKEAAEFITTKFTPPIKLEFEKVYFPYLLINKKRYAGLYYTTPEKYDKLDCKGLETVRRDNCLLVTLLLDSCLNKILVERDPDGAVDLVKKTISDLLTDRIDISQLIITKELRKTKYMAKQAHACLVEKIKKRTPNNVPKLGDRIQYVIIKLDNTKKMPTYECAEDPMYVLVNSIPIDYDYYLNNQLCKPLLRIFEPIFGEKTEIILFRGDHILSKTIKNNPCSMLAKFIIKRSTCINCKHPVTNNESLFCNSCDTHLNIDSKKCYYERETQKLNEYKENYFKLWNQCKNCQGCGDDFPIEELTECVNKDCEIFYSRTKAKINFQKQCKITDKIMEW